MPRRSYTDRTLKILFAGSGNRCAFPGCDRALVAFENDTTEDVVLGEIAHIVGLAEGSARWRDDMSDAERNAPENLVVLCRDHHRIVDDKANERRYSEVVMRRMKSEHEEEQGPSRPASSEPPLVDETLTTSMLIVDSLPGSLYSASCSENNPMGVVRRIQRGALHGSDLVPFYVHDGRLWSFWDLSDETGPLSAACDVSTVERLAADEAWSDPDLRRRYVALLNRSMSLHLERRGLGRDERHDRYFFMARRAGEERIVHCESLRGRSQSLRVVREERRKTGERKGVWWHQAVRLRFEQIGPLSWFVTIRPEFHLTADGVAPLPERRVKGRVTRRKSTMYNEQYLNRVHFWRWFLTHGDPRVVMRVGQPIVVSAQPVEVEVRWPGVPDDDSEPVDVEFEETLLTLAELADAVGNVRDWERLIA